jgi:hypothetical protein
MATINRKELLRSRTGLLFSIVFTPLPICLSDTAEITLFITTMYPHISSTQFDTIILQALWFTRGNHEIMEAFSVASSQGP